MATQIIKLSSLPAVSSLNQVNAKGDIGRVGVEGGGRQKGIRKVTFMDNNKISTVVLLSVAGCPISICSIYHTSE